LAQLTIVGDDYTGPALLIDDLLTGVALRHSCGAAGGAALPSTKTASAKTALFMTLPLIHLGTELA
jgi:hypothetical protein